MERRRFVGAAVSLPFAARFPGAAAATAPLARVRPGDPGWPSTARWDRLRAQTGGRLAAVQSPFDACRSDPTGVGCLELFRSLKNPYAIGDNVALTQTTGWADAWTSQPSIYAVPAESATDVAATVNFARENKLRLVVKGGGHSYLGTSSAPDSLLIWTRRMNGIVLHDGFVPQGCDIPPVPAVSVGAGAIWMHTYDAVTTHGGRYVQGGGCATVGVAGLVLGGGFGSYSKAYGTAAASLLEAEVVTADGLVRIANSCLQPDLFWALKGGGGGSFGVVTRLTLRTHALPNHFGFVSVSIHAMSDSGFRALIARFVDFCADSLMNPHWGEIVNIRRGRQLEISMASQALDGAEMEAIWQPFLRWVATSGELSFLTPPLIRSGPARHRWDPTFLRSHLAGAVLSDSRPNAASANIFWSANLSEAGHFIHGYDSTWLPAALLRSAEQRGHLSNALFEAGRIWPIELHFQKGLAGASPAVIEAAAQTATNPAMREAFALAILGSEGPPARPGLPGYQPDLAAARRDAAQIGKAMGVLRDLAPDSGSYVAESNFFEPDWQRSYWGANYARLLEVKRRYDPEGLFFVHHGVGSEIWNADGFTPAGER
jgi:FAD binding domain/Berberine and berberine like